MIAPARISSVDLRPRFSPRLRIVPIKPEASSDGLQANFRLGEKVRLTTWRADNG